MSYVVLARKWRPQTFADLTGQQHVAQTLGNAIHQERVPHALLFTGARGVGKTSSARILAMALNCAKGPTVSPCGVCDACVEIQKGANVDVLEIDGASNRGINEIRELRDGVRYAPNRDRYKVYIIDEVHMLTTEAFNALLKTLEEPPRHVVFILATTEVHKIPVTILSRCQRFDFRRIPHGEIVDRLAWIAEQEKLSIERSVLGMIARQAQGGMRDALSLMDQVIAFAGTTVTAEVAAGILGASERKRLFELSAAVIDRNVDHALGVVDNIAAFGVNMQHFASEFLEHLRDLTVIAASHGRSQLTALTDDELEIARGQVARSDAATLHRMFELMMETTDAVARSNHARLVLDMGVVRLASLEPMSSVQSVIDRLHALARGETLPPMAAPPASSAPPASPPPASSAPLASTPPVASATSASSVGVQAITTVVAVAIENADPVEQVYTAHSVAPQVAQEHVDAAPEPLSVSEQADVTAAATLPHDSDLPVADASSPAVVRELAPAAESHEVSVEAVQPVEADAGAVSTSDVDGSTLKDADRGADGDNTIADTAETDAEPQDGTPASASADAPVQMDSAQADAAAEMAQAEADAAAERASAEPERTAALPGPPTVAADAGSFTTLVERWKEMLDQIAEERPNVYGLLQDVTVLPGTAESNGAIRLAAAAQLMGRLTAEVMELLQSTVDLYLGQRLTFVVIDANHVPLSEIAQGFHLALHEQRVREQREEEIRVHVTEHPATRLILTRWPGSRIRDIRFVDGFEEKPL